LPTHSLAVRVGIASIRALNAVSICVITNSTSRASCSRPFSRFSFSWAVSASAAIFVLRSSSHRVCPVSSARIWVFRCLM
jgi:hypothetical protein